LDAALSGAGRYLSSVLVAVLLAPVLPDIAVDVFGGGEPRWRDPLLRGLAVIAVCVACVGVYRYRRWRLVRSASASVRSLPACDVLVLPMSASSTFRVPQRQAGDYSVPEYLVNNTTPSVVVAVATRETSQRLAGLTAALSECDITVHSVTIDDPQDPRATVRDIPARVGELIEEFGLAGQRICVDVTGGTGAMSLGMLRLAALRAAECVYVSSDFDGTGRVPRTQRGHSFDPTQLFGATG